MGKHGDYPDDWDKLDTGGYGGATYLKKMVRESCNSKADNFAPWGGIPQRGNVSNADTSDREHIPSESQPYIDRICGNVKERIRDITAEVRKENMIPTTGNDGGNAGKRKRTGFPYVTIDDLSKSPQEFRVIGAKLDKEGQYGPRIILKGAFKGETYLFTLNIKNNPNVVALTEKFGRDENDWVDKKFTVFAEEDDFTGRLQIRVGFTAGKK